MALIATIPQQPIIVDSFWNLIQNADESVQKELFVRLNRKYSYGPHKGKSSYTDKELEELLSEYSPITESDFPEVSHEQYMNYIRSRSGIMAKGIERWL